MKKISYDSWRKYFLSRGISPDYVQAYLSYIEKLSSTSSPVIFEFEHLSKLIGVEYDALRSMVNSPSSYYRVFNIKKRAGGLREIHAPYPSLLMCQDWIYRNILLSKPVHAAAHGFVPGRSIFSNASKHLGKKCLLKMDVKNFFPSIKINWVINYFQTIGYADNVSFYLASLCCSDGALVQGSSASPYISNLLLYGLDARLSKLAKSYGVEYTRYADDLTFSGDYIPHFFIGFVTEIVADYGLSVNEGKTRLKIGDGQKIVTGLSVAGEKLKIPREHKRRMKQELHFIRKYGYLSHMAKQKRRDPFALESLLGRFSFWLQAEPDSSDARGGVEYLKSIRWL